MWSLQLIGMQLGLDLVMFQDDMVFSEIVDGAVCKEDEE
jgi:hypothetical protein